MHNKESEQTLVLIKPDTLKNSLTGYVLSLLSEFHTGLYFAGLKVVHVTRMLAEEHYAEHRGKAFFSSLIDYIMGNLHYPHEPHKRRVIAIVYQGPDAVEKLRALSGPTNPNVAREQQPGCIRSLGAVIDLVNETGQVVGQRYDNVIHASATLEEAEREIKLWFKPDEIPPFMRAFATQQSDEHFYYKEGQLLTTYQPGSICLIAAGDTVWKSDLDALRLIHQGRPAPCTLQTVAAKYLVHEAYVEN